MHLKKSQILDLAREDIDSCNIRPSLIEKLVDLPARKGVSRGKLWVLDLGCGVDRNEDYSCYERGSARPLNEIWASRAAQGGWKVVGVDQFGMKEKPTDWIFVQRDLTRAAAFRSLPVKLFDAVVGSRFISFDSSGQTSPSLNVGKFVGSDCYPFNSTGLQSYGGQSFEDLPDFDKQYVSFLEVFLARVRNVLKDGGLAIFNHDVLQRNGDELTIIRQSTKQSLLKIIDLGHEK